MAASDNTISYGGNRGTGRLQIAAFLVVVGIVLAAMAVKFQTQLFRTSSRVARRADAKYSRLWIDNSGELIGARLEGSKLLLERWSTPADVRWSVDFGPGAEPVWSFSPDLRRVVWIAGNTLRSKSDVGGTASIPLPPDSEPIAAGALSDGSLGAAFRDGNVLRWDGATGRLADSFHISLTGADQAVMQEDYLGLASDAARTLLLYRLQDGKWKLAQQARAPDPPFQLLLPAPGMLAELTSGSLRAGDETRNTGGAVHSAVADLEDLIATGDFRGAYALPPQREQYLLADAEPGSVLAAGQKHLALSGPDGTSVFQLGSEYRLTATGRNMSLIAILLLAMAAVLAFGGVLLDLLSRLFGDKGVRTKQARIPMTISDPPADLIKAIAHEECSLWAGAGLGAQAGYPVRQAFATMLMQTVAVEAWVTSSLAQKLQRLCLSGKHEEAIDELVRQAPEQRGKMVEFLRTSYGRFGVPSRTHELLMRMSIPSAVTTSYDPLLEQLREKWLDHTLTLGDRPEGPQFVLKLFGNLRSPRSVLLSSDEFAQAVGSSPLAVHVAQAMETRTFLFIGCSLEGLLADLARFNIGATPTRTHYAIAGVSGSRWEALTGQLTRRYGIECLVCAEEDISRALTAFLEKLADEVARLQRVIAVSSGQ